MATATTTLDRLQVQGPVELTHLLKADFQVAGNQHGKLVLHGYLAPENAADVLLRGVDGQAVSFLGAFNENENLSPIFCGMPTDFKVRREGNVFKAELTVSTGTTLLDSTKRSRSFQDVSMTYQQVVYAVLNDTPKAAATFAQIANTPIGKPIIQYQETDWDFIKRLASMLGTQLLPDCTTSNPQFSFGVPGYAADNFLAENYSTKIDKRFYELGGDAAGHYKADFLCYDATSNAYYKLGSKTSFMGQSFYVCAHYGFLDKGELTYRYKLGKAGLCGERLMRNRKLTGLSLDGKVLSSDVETVKLALDIDNGQPGVYPFSWAPETGNIMYCMPKVGTRARLFLADGDTSNAIACSSPRSNGDSCAAMADTQKRCFVTEHGKQMCLYPESMVFSAGQPSDVNPLQVKLEELNCLLMESPKAVQIVAKFRVSIEAPNVSLYTPQELQAKRSVVETQAKLSLIVPKGTACGNPPTGGGDTALVMQYQFDALGSQGILCGTVTSDFGLFLDAPAEFNLAGWLVNIAIGAVVAIACVAAAVLIPGLGAIAVGALIGAAMGAAAVTATIAIEDYNDGEVRSWQVAASQIMVGAVAGGFIGGSAAALFPAGVGTMQTLVAFDVLSGMMLRTATAGAMEGLDFWRKNAFIFNPISVVTDGLFGGIFGGVSNLLKLGTAFPSQQLVSMYNTSQAALAANAARQAMSGAGNEGGSGAARVGEDIGALLKNGKTPDDLLKSGYSVDDLLKAGVMPDDLPGYQHLVTGEGLIRKKAQVGGGHNIDSFYAAIKQDAQSLGLDISDYNIKVTKHPTIDGLYQIEYSIPRVNGNTNPLTPLYDDMGNLLTKPADDFKTVYNTAEIGFSDAEIYTMGKQALEAEILAGNISGYNVQATINGITFKGYYRNGVLTNFYPIF